MRHLSEHVHEALGLNNMNESTIKNKSTFDEITIGVVFRLDNSADEYIKINDKTAENILTHREKKIKSTESISILDIEDLSQYVQNKRKHVEVFEQYIAEVTQHDVSGTSGRTITVLDNRKYKLLHDVKDAKIGNFVGVVLPKDTIISNLPGGVFAHHHLLKKYASSTNRWHESYGLRVTTIPKTLISIEQNSQILESNLESEFLVEEILSSDELVNEGGIIDILKSIAKGDLVEIASLALAPKEMAQASATREITQVLNKNGIIGDDTAKVVDTVMKYSSLFRKLLS